MFIGICSRSQVSVYRTIGPLVTDSNLDFSSLLQLSHIGPPLDQLANLHSDTLRDLAPLS